MFSLPSTTEFNVPLPKENFYRAMNVGAALRREFIDGVQQIAVVNDIKPRTANVADGARVHEIFIVAATPKGDAVPEGVIRAICTANESPTVVYDTGAERASVLVRGRLMSVLAPAELRLTGFNLDATWDSMLAQLVLGELNGEGVVERIERREKIKALTAEVASLDAKARKERQISRRNDLFAQLKKKQAELAELEKEM